MSRQVWTEQFPDGSIAEYTTSPAQRSAPYQAIFAAWIEATDRNAHPGRERCFRFWLMNRVFEGLRGEQLLEAARRAVPQSGIAV